MSLSSLAVVQLDAPTLHAQRQWSGWVLPATREGYLKKKIHFRWWLECQDRPRPANLKQLGSTKKWIIPSGKGWRWLWKMDRDLNEFYNQMRVFSHRTVGVRQGHPSASYRLCCSTFFWRTSWMKSSTTIRLLPSMEGRFATYILQTMIEGTNRELQDLANRMTDSSVSY